MIKSCCPLLEAVTRRSQDSRWRSSEFVSHAFWSLSSDHQLLSKDTDQLDQTTSPPSSAFLFLYVVLSRPQPYHKKCRVKVFVNVYLSWAKRSALNLFLNTAQVSHPGNTQDTYVSRKESPVVVNWNYSTAARYQNQNSPNAQCTQEFYCDGDALWSHPCLVQQVNLYY